MLCSLLLHTIVGPRTGRKRGIDLSSSTACTQGLYFLTIFLTHDSAERNLPTVFNSSVSLPHAVNETGFESRADAWNDLFFFSFFPHPPAFMLHFQVSRSSSPSTYKRSLSSLPWATSCAMGRASTSVGTASVAANAQRSSHSATAPSPTSRSWSTL